MIAAYFETHSGLLYHESRLVVAYGKPNGAKFKKQNWLHIQQICYQGQGGFQSSSTKSIHVQPIFSQGQDI